MKKKAILLIPVLLTVMLALTVQANRMHHEEESIKTVIESGYVHGAFNELNPEEMLKTFHKDFAIFSPGENGEINKYPIAVWAERTEQRKADPDFNPENNVWEHKFTRIDVSGEAAAVQIELYNGGKHIFTDYLSLLKFDNEWKIVAKVYHRHLTP